MEPNFNGSAYSRRLAIGLALLAIMSAAAIVVLPDDSDANTAQYGGLYYTYYSSGTSCSVTGYIGEPAEITIPKSVSLPAGTETTVDEDGEVHERTVYKRFLVTSVGYEAFKNCVSLRSTTIPSSVLYIANRAFCGCTSLESVGDTSKVTSFENQAFYECSSLASVDLSGATSISNGAFEDCSSLASVGDLSSVTSIGNYAFKRCASLESVGDTSKVTSFGNQAFWGCSSLASVGDTSKVTDIAHRAFWGCSSLASVDLSGATSIGWEAFHGCSSLAKVTIPDTVESIGSGAFLGLRFFEYAGGDPLPHDAGSLRGYTYAGPGDGNLYRQADTVTITLHYVRADLGDAVKWRRELSALGYEKYADVEWDQVTGLARFHLRIGEDYRQFFLSHRDPGLFGPKFSNLMNEGWSYSYDGGRMWKYSDVVEGDTDLYAQYGLVFESYDPRYQSIGKLESDPVMKNGVTEVRYELGMLYDVLLETYRYHPSLYPTFWYGTDWPELGDDMPIPPETDIRSLLDIDGDYRFNTEGFSDPFTDDLTMVLQSLILEDPNLIEVTKPEDFSKMAKTIIKNYIKLGTAMLIIDGHPEMARVVDTSLMNAEIADALLEFKNGKILLKGLKSDWKALVFLTLEENAYAIGKWAGGTIAMAFNADPWKEFGLDAESIEVRGTKTYADGFDHGLVADSKYLDWSPTDLSGIDVYGALGDVRIVLVEKKDRDGRLTASVEYEAVVKRTAYLHGDKSEFTEKKLMPVRPVPVASIDTYKNRIIMSESCDDDQCYNVTIEVHGEDVPKLSYSGTYVDQTLIANSMGSLSNLELRSRAPGLTIGEGAFSDCPRLRTVLMDEGVTYIEDGAFAGCPSLETVAIPSSVTYIGDGAFGGTEFYSDGVLLEMTSDALAGHVYAGSGGRLDRVGAGFTTEHDGIVYTVTSLYPLECSATGYTGEPRSLAIPESVPVLWNEAKVVSVGAKAFMGCRTLTSADLGSVSYIGPKAFANCTALRIVDLGDSAETVSAYAFYRCVRLAEVDAADSAKTLRAVGSYAFYKCDRLGSIAVPSFVRVIGDESPFPADLADEDGNVLEAVPEAVRGYVYSKDEGLLVRQAGPEIGTEYDGGKLKYRVISTLPAELEVYHHSGTFRNITIPETAEFDGHEFEVTAIGDRAFKDYVKIRTVSMPYVEKIGKEAFYGCAYVKPVDMYSLKSIGVKAFARCSSMGSVALWDPLEKISAYAFYGCRSLESVDVPDTVASIGSYAFYKCSSLGEVHLGESLKKIGSRAFAHTALEGVEIPRSVASIGSYAFSGCPDLASVDIRGPLVSIGAGAFASCPSLGHVYMPDAIKKLGSKAFSGVVFKDADGKAMKHTAKNLSGRTFEGSAGTLVLAS